MRLFGVMVVAGVLAVSAQAQQEPIVADRPGFADGSATVGKSTVQLEVGANLEDAGESFLSLPTLLRIGLTDALELRIESDVIGFSDGDQDLAPIAAGFKLRLLEGDVPLSLLASVQPPSGGRTFGATQFESEIRLVSDINLGNGLSLTPNAGIALVEGDGPSAVVAATLEKELGHVLPFVDVEARTGHGTSMIIDGGVAWIVNNDTQLDVAGGFDVAGDEYPDWFITAGISRRF
jgi:hypothetical protein